MERVALNYKETKIIKARATSERDSCNHTQDLQFDISEILQSILF